MGKKVLVFLATGFEEIEAVSIIDVIRRSGISVTITAVSSQLEVQGANGIIIKADKLIDEIKDDEFDMIVLPGGWGGTDILAEHPIVQDIIKKQNQKNKLIGAICAAPFALDKAGVLKGKFTCYPSVEEKIDNSEYTMEEKVVVDSNIVTSRGPATAICFGLEIVKQLVDEDTYSQLKSGLLADFC